MKATSIAIINGPNLNMLGKRDQKIYGSFTLKDIEEACALRAQKDSFTTDFRQSNYEGDLVTWIQELINSDKYCGCLINAAAYTHSSIAILDALSMLSIPVIEVHLSNIYEREKYRHTSYITPVADKVIYGHKDQSYILALDYLISSLK